MSYYLWLKQEGCEYVACGEKLIRLDTEDLTLIEREIEQHLDYHCVGTCIGNDHYTAALLLKLDRDIMPLVKHRREASRKRIEQELLNEKREQLERLKRELGED